MQGDSSLVLVDLGEEAKFGSWCKRGLTVKVFRARSQLPGSLPLTIAEIPPERRAIQKLAAFFGIRTDKWDEQVLRIGETVTHEKAIAALHRRSSTQTG